MSFTDKIKEGENLPKNVYLLLSQIVRETECLKTLKEVTEGRVDPTSSPVYVQAHRINVLAGQGLIEMGNIIEQGIKPIEKGSRNPFREQVNKLSESGKAKFDPNWALGTSLAGHEEQKLKDVVSYEEPGRA